MTAPENRGIEAVKGIITNLRHSISKHKEPTNSTIELVQGQQIEFLKIWESVLVRLILTVDVPHEELLIEHNALKNAVSKVEDVCKIQCSERNYDHDDYMLGMVNGLILALAILNDVEPQYLTRKPKENNDTEEATSRTEPSRGQTV